MDTISNILRRVIRESGISIRRLYLDTGIGRLSLSRFMEGRQLTSNNIDTLAHYFDLTLTEIPRRGKAKKES